MTRVVRRADGQVAIDSTGKAAGRGAYIHQRQACWQAALKAGHLLHALRVTELSAEDRAALQAYAAALPKEDGTES